jgi:protein-S-isoprenylcysteine O-methyltransferase Ste14
MNKVYDPNTTGLNFASWTTDTSPAGNWAQIVDNETNNTLLTDGSWKITESSESG